MQRFKKFVRGVLLMAALSVLTIAAPVLAQNDEQSITFTGVVTEVSAETAVIGGIAVDITGAVLPVGGLTVGMTVEVIGVAEGQVIRATIIVVVADVAPIATATPSNMATEIPADVTPTPVIVPTATSTGNNDDGGSVIIIDDTPIIVIEGPVVEINIDTIRIFNIDIRVDPGDPILTRIRIGDTIRVEGQADRDGTTIVIVAVNITIIQTTVIVINNPGVIYVPVGLPANCRRTPKGKITCKRTRR